MADPGQTAEGFDLGSVLARLGEPATWGLLSQFPPASARRILQTVVREMAELSLTDRDRERRDGQILENLRRLGISLSPGKARAFLARHHQLQALRQAEELLCLHGDVSAQLRWVEESFVARGLAHARRVARAGRGAVVVSAHLGPLVHYICLLSYYLSRSGPAPEILAVMNEPADENARTIRVQLDRYASHHASQFSVLAKAPGGEIRLLRELTRALGRNAWILMQMDTVTGGTGSRPLPFAGQELLLPGVWGAVRLAAHCGVPVLPVLALRRGSEGLGLRVEPAVNVTDVTGAARYLARLLERWVLRDVADWGQLPSLHLLLRDGG